MEGVYLKKNTYASQEGVLPVNCVDSPEGSLSFHFMDTGDISFLKEVLSSYITRVVLHVLWSFQTLSITF